MRWHHDVKFTNHCNYNASCTRKVHRQEYEKAKRINKAEKSLSIYIELYRMVNSVQNAKWEQHQCKKCWPQPLAGIFQTHSQYGPIKLKIEQLTDWTNNFTIFEIPPTNDSGNQSALMSSYPKIRDQEAAIKLSTSWTDEQKKEILNIQSGVCFFQFWLIKTNKGILLLCKICKHLRRSSLRRCWTLDFYCETKLNQTLFLGMHTWYQNVLLIFWYSFWLRSRGKRNSPVHLLLWLIIRDSHTELHGHIPLDDVHGTTDETMAEITTNGTVRNKANTP